MQKHVESISKSLCGTDSAAKYAIKLPKYDFAGLTTDSMQLLLLCSCEGYVVAAAACREANKLRCTYLETLLNDIQEDEEAEDVHAPHGNGPKQVRPEEPVLCAHGVVVPT